MRADISPKEIMMPTGWNQIAAKLLGLSLVSLFVLCVPALATEQFGTPKGDEGTRIFKATEHQHYSGTFHLSGQKTTLIGSMQDRAPLMMREKSQWLMAYSWWQVLIARTVRA
jgi:hypothetical protein